MIRYHTGGHRCDVAESCHRWHTETAPAVDTEASTFTFPTGTEWLTPTGEAVGTTDRPETGKWVPPAPPPGPEDDQSPRASALNEARDLITGDRNAQYGPPTQDFQRTANLLNALGYRRVDAEGNVVDILASDVGLMIMQVKMSRAMHSRQKRDHYVDMAGYAACSYECAVEEEKDA